MDGFTGEADLSRGRLHQSGNGSQQGGLSGAVSPDDAHHFPFFHGQGNIEDDLNVPVKHVDMVDLKQRHSLLPDRP